MSKLDSRLEWDIPIGITFGTLTCVLVLPSTYKEPRVAARTFTNTFTDPDGESFVVDIGEALQQSLL